MPLLFTIFITTFFSFLFLFILAKMKTPPLPPTPIIIAREMLTSVEKLGYKKCVFTDVSPENIQILEKKELFGARKELTLS